MSRQESFTISEAYVVIRDFVDKKRRYSISFKKGEILFALPPEAHAYNRLFRRPNSMVIIPMTASMAYAYLRPVNKEAAEILFHK